MPRDNRLFKTQVNRVLDLLTVQGQAALGSEAELAHRLKASRTTIRAALSHLHDLGVLSWDGRDKRLLRAPRPQDYFASAEARTTTETVEQRFLSWVLGAQPAPGTILNETRLARELDLPLAGLREYLIRFQPFGLIEKQPNRHWVMKGFTRAFADEMFEVRVLLEQRALARLIAQPDPALIANLSALRANHLRVRDGIEAEAMGFPALDARFHALLCEGARNRFILDFSRTTSIIVHYHYLWNRKGEAGRNRNAADEHLAILDAIEAGCAETARTALQKHLETAHRTLLASVPWPDGPDELSTFSVDAFGDETGER